ncbi:ABC transporter permease [Gulosibacter faecalis]|jgi:osmoprotectant transport system permease protein|uniref:ABC transporter permease n=1 Tax=Gulosibacter faecalis TaxID=272240 RepID=A0ABW5V0H3_9MICO|nr:ABC transporter permease [Gulosibacter faecalis]
MSGFTFEKLLNFLESRWADILLLIGEHFAVTLLSVGIAFIVGMTIGILVWQQPFWRELSISTSAILMTVPSLAVLALLSPVLGLGWGPTIVALVIYALLPIIRNTAVGLREVPPAILESARGVGMSGPRTLLTVQLPLAWPVILTGARVATQLAVGIAAIAAYVAGPGLGQYIFRGLSTLGSAHALNYALVGTVATIIVALILDGAFTILIRFTTSKGLK